MKRVANYFDNPPKTLSVKNLERYGVFEEIIVKKQKVESKHYNRVGVKKQLLEIFNHRCAYCERRVSIHDAIDHFRPKSATAYFWLSIIWSNLLIACRECNSFKSDNFDIEGKKATIPNYKTWADFIAKTHIEAKIFLSEKPKMLHPVLDKPEEHLSFQENGTVTTKTIRGQYFIECCKISDFNKGQLLISDRQNIVETLRNTLKSYDIIKNETELHDLLITLLLNLTEAIEKEQFSAVYRACFNNFDDFFITKFAEPYQSKLRKVYQEIMAF